MAYNKETGMYEGFIYKIWNDVNDKLYIGQTKATIKDRWHGHMSSALCEKRSKSALYNAMRKYGRDKFHIEQIDKIEAESLELLTEKLDELEILRINQYDSYSYKGTGYNCEFGGVGKRKRIVGRTVCKYDDELNLLDTYDSIQEAGRMNNIDGATIWAVCNHHYYRAAGFIWAYEGEQPIPAPDNNVNNERIFVYNAFGEIISIYNNIESAVICIPISRSHLLRILRGDRLEYKHMIIRLENQPFDCYPRSKRLRPIVVKMQNGDLKRFESLKMASDYLGSDSGTIIKAIKNNWKVNNCQVFYYDDYYK